VAKRSRSRRHAAAAPPTPSAPPAPPGGRRVTITLSLTFALGAGAALLVPATGAALLGLLVVLGGTLGGLRLAPVLGLPRGAAAALAAGVGFALILVYGAVAGLPAGLAVPALAVTALAGLLVVDVVAVTPAPAASRGARLANALGRGPALRAAATLALGALAARAGWVALRTEHDAALAVALLAVVAGVLPWRAPAPRGTLLAALLLGLVPAMVALGVGTDYGLWPPITATLTVVLGGSPPRPLPLALASLVAAALAGVLTIVQAAPPAEPAGIPPAADPVAR
jgi:hypothetical protein